MCGFAIETGRGFGLAEACRKLGITEQSFGTSCSMGNSSIRCGKDWLGIAA